MTLDGEVLGQFGSLSVPGHIWRTLQRLGSWVERSSWANGPALCVLTASAWAE
jgi:hypothetical protein